MQLFSAITALALLASSASAQQHTATPPVVAALAAASGNLNVSTLISLVSAQPAILNLVSTVSTNTTIFAPTNSAFAAFLASPPAGFDATVATQVADVLTYHVAPVFFAPTKPREFISTLRANPGFGGAPTKLRVDFDGTAVKVFYGLSSATVLNSVTVPLASGTAIVHFIDKVLFPPASAAATASAVPDLSTLVSALTSANLVGAVTSATNITVFAPLNSAFAAIASTTSALNATQLASVLTYHVVPGVFYSTDIVAVGPSLPNIPTLFTGNTLSSSNNRTAVTVSGASNTVPANVVIPDVLIANGVVHVIDAVLIPSLASLGLSGGAASTTSSGARASGTPVLASGASSNVKVGGFAAAAGGVAIAAMLL